MNTLQTATDLQICKELTVCRLQCQLFALESADWSEQFQHCMGLLEMSERPIQHEARTGQRVARLERRVEILIDSMFIVIYSHTRVTLKRLTYMPNVT